jgi:hypothetical protein
MSDHFRLYIITLSDHCHLIEVFITGCKKFVRIHVERFLDEQWMDHRLSFDESGFLSVSHSSDKRTIVIVAERMRPHPSMVNLRDSDLIGFRPQDSNGNS